MTGAEDVEGRASAQMTSTSNSKTFVWTGSYEQLVIVAIAVSIVVRLVCAALVPLAFDEALYWRYSKHLAAGFLDHPAMNPLMIRLGTSLFGDTPLGARFFAVLLAVPATWALWRAGASLFNSERLGATAALFFNLTLVMTVGSLLATSDEVVVTTTCFLLYALSRLNETGRGEWWLAVGAAFGLGMFSKYTTAFFAVSMLAWLVIVPERRKWLISPWAWAGGALALIIFSPVLLWNYEHHWASLVYQSNRMVVHAWTLRYLGELVASTLGMATPPIFILGCIGLFWSARQQSAPLSSRVLLGAMVWPIFIYFAWHSLHERVQGNWPEPLYPAFVVAAALAVHQLRGRTGILATTARWSARSALPIGVLLAAAVYSQAIFGLLPLGRKDPTSRMLGAGWPELAVKIDQTRAQLQLPLIVTTEYEPAGWLSFYLPTSTPVEQLTQRIRWVNEPAPDAALLAGPALYVCKNECSRLDVIKGKYATVEFVQTFARTRDNVEIEHYSVYRLAAPLAPVLDPLYADMTAGQTQ